ncbi:PH domain-containing protein [Gilvimarinus sp. F26214L]|uniref:PH domain-containing protein n=1 Tax=Gilvimarinus sp. DZF01 TaxID=3461371 RepID=UPI0040452BCB
MTLTSEWRRVSPLAIFYFVFDALRQAVNLWPALLAVLAGGEQVRSNFVTFGLPGLLVVFAASVFLHFWFFRYKAEGDRIQLQRGVFSRNRLTLYFDRVQQADIAQPFYFRPFGLATLGLESAGSSRQEVDIPGLRYPEAEALKSAILARRQAAEVRSDEGSQPADVEPDFQLHLSWREVLRYGLMYNGLLFLAPVIAPFTQHLGPSMQDWFAGLEGTFVHGALAELFNRSRLWLAVLVAGVAVLSGLLVLFFISMLIALFRFWDYRLTRTGDQFQYRAGLGTVRTRGFRIHKLQQVTVTQGLVARLLRRHTLKISKAGGAGPGQEEHRKHFLVPVLSNTTLRALEQQLSVPRVRWRRVHPAYILLRGGLTACALSLVLLLLRPEFMAGVPLIILACFLLAWRYWFVLGYYQDGHWTSMRTGLVGSRSTWLPAGKTQKLSVTEPPWLKPWRLANLSVWGADGRVTIPCVPLGVAQAMRDQSLYQAVTFRGRWF